MRFANLILASLLIGVGSPAVAIGPGYVTTLEETDTGATLRYFATTCLEAVRAECGFATFICEGPAVSLVIEGLASRELGEWLIRGLSAEVTGRSADDLTPSSMAMTEANGWAVRFDVADGTDWLKRLPNPPNLTVTEFHGSTELSIGPSDQARFSRFVADCARANRGP